MNGPWLARTESAGVRLGAQALVTVLSVQDAIAPDTAAFAEDHLAELALRLPRWRVTDPEPATLPGGGALLRYGSSPADDEHLVVLYRTARGLRQAITAAGALPFDELTEEILRYTLDDGALRLTIEEFRVLERVAGVPPAAFIGPSRLIELADDEPGGVVEALARSLAIRGVLQRDHESGGWALRERAGSIVAPLIGSRQVAWITLTSAAEGGSETGSLAFGRVHGGWSAVQHDDGGVLVTALDAVEPARFAALMCGIFAADAAGTGDPVSLPSHAIAPGSEAPGAGRIAEFGAARFLRPSGGGLEHHELEWFRNEHGGLWQVTREGEVITAAPVEGTSLLAALADGFEVAEAER